MPDACQHGRCINTLGSYRCLCEAGYQVDSAQRDSQCIDVDECDTVSPSPCEFGCRNTPGTFVCTCPVGYSLSTDARTCVDIDECDSQVSGHHACAQNCLNTRGSYECVCHDGYQRQDDQCVGQSNFTVFRKKTPTYVFDYNSGVSWSIFTCVSYAEARNRYRLDVCLSVRPSVCLSHAGTVSKRLNILS